MDKNIIFVDCFNTIICRKKSPKDVLFDWATELGDFFSIEPGVIYKLYKRCQIKTGIRNKLKSGESEYLFSDVVAQVYDCLLKLDKLEFDKREFVDKSLDLYISVEEKNHYLNDEVISILKEYKGQGKKIFVVSDFYCGSEVLKGWLRALEVDSLFDDIFVSCDFWKSKRTGRLYKHLLKEFSFNKKEVIMIGDNRHADYHKARANGLKAIKINSKNKKNDAKLKLRMKKGANYPQYQEIFDLFGEKFNYSNYAFPFYLYYKRLCQKLQENNVQNVLFMSREGQFMKKLFDEYCRQNGYNFKSHYFYVSRNSVLTASLLPLEEENFDIMLRSIGTMNIKRFLTTLNFTNEEIKSLEDKMNSSFQKASKNFLKSNEFSELKNLKEFRELYSQKRKEQKESLDCYLKSFDIDFEKEGMHLVDVGWFGTIQDFLAKYWGGRTQTVGYYVGTFDKKKMPNSQKIGLIFSKPNNGIYGNKILRHRRLDYEQIYRADHNRCKGYRVVNGKPEIILGDEQDENKIFNELILPLQNQIYEKFTRICKLDYKHLSTIEPLTLKMFYKMIQNQSKEDWLWLRKCEDSTYDNFARVGYTYTKFSDRLRIFAYKTLDFFFKIRFVLKIKTLKYIKTK